MFCLSMLFVIAGCGGAKDARHKDLTPAAGTIFYKGTPVDDATIVFHHEDAAKQGGSAISQADGTFVLRTFTGEGTYPGTYKVTVIKDKVTYPVSDEEMMRLEREGQDVPSPITQSLLPKKYRLKTTTDLTFTIPPTGDKELKIELAD